MFKRGKLQEKKDDGKGSGAKAPLSLKSAEQVLKDVKVDPGMERIIAFMKGAKPEPEEIFEGDYLRGDDLPKGTGYKLK